MDCSPPGYSVHGSLQARILELVAIPFSSNLPNPGIEPGSPTLQADSLPSEPPGKPLLKPYCQKKQKQKHHTVFFLLPHGYTPDFHQGW